MNETYEDLRVKKIEKRTTRDDKGESTLHTMLAEDTESETKIRITQPDAFDGIKIDDTITVRVSNPQKTLKQ